MSTPVCTDCQKPAECTYREDIQTHYQYYEEYSHYFCIRCFKIRAWNWLKYNEALPWRRCERTDFLEGEVAYSHPSQNQEQNDMAAALKKNYPYTLSEEEELEFQQYWEAHPVLEDEFLSYTILPLHPEQEWSEEEDEPTTE